MSANSCPTPYDFYPVRIWPAVLLGLLTCVGTFLLGAVVPSPWDYCCGLVASIGHGISLGLVVILILEWRVWSKCHRDLNHAMQEDTSKFGRTERVSFWNAAVDVSPQMGFFPGINELPKVYRLIRTTWQDQLTNRQVIFLGLAAIPTVAGCVEGTLQLQLSEQGVYLRGFSHVYFPLLVGTIETLLLGIGIFIINRLWLDTVARWELWATQMVDRELQQTSSYSSQNQDSTTPGSNSGFNGQSKVNGGGVDDLPPPTEPNLPPSPSEQQPQELGSSVNTQMANEHQQQEGQAHLSNDPISSDVPSEATDSGWDFGEDSGPVGIDHEELEGADGP